MLTQLDIKNFEVVLANGKVGRFDSASELDSFYQRSRTMTGTPKKKKKKKVVEDEEDLSLEAKSPEYRRKLKRCQPKARHSTLVRNKPGNEALRKKLKLS